MVVSESLGLLSETVNRPSSLGSPAIASLAVMVTSAVSSSEMVRLAVLVGPTVISLSPDATESIVKRQRF